MARPQKQIVDYFPHIAHSEASDTLTVLENKFGNDGYAFWFKLLERLALTEGHFIDCRNDAKWQVLLARLGTNEVSGKEMMFLLVEMGAIDKGLWDSRIIWCDNFIKNIAHVYKNRKQPLPQKPVITTDNPVSTTDNPVSTPSLSVETPHSIVKYSIVNNNKYSDDSLEIKLSNNLKDKILQNNPRAKVPNNLQKWAHEFHLLMVKDKYKPEEIEKVIDFSQSDKFWKTNILSAPKLRIQYDKLFLQSNNGGNHGQTAAYRGNPSQKPTGAFSGLE